MNRRSIEPILIRDISQADYVTDDYEEYWNASGESVTATQAVASGRQVLKIAGFNTVTHRYNRDTGCWDRAEYEPQVSELTGD